MQFAPLPTGKVTKSAHYHGDKVRILFFVAGVLMLIGLPIFQNRIPFHISFSLGSLILLAFLAGLTNPREVWLSFLDTAASLIGLTIFEYFAVRNFFLTDYFFWLNQILAIIFFLSFYYSVKTLRGFYLRDK